MLAEDLAQIGSSYLTLVGAAAWKMVAGALVALGAAWCFDRLSARGLSVGRWAVCLGAIGVGLSLAASRLSLFDDAYVSFRYAQNLIDGHGLVWNLDERVEGYTNFLWTILIATFAWVGRIDPPTVGLWLSLAVWPLHLIVVYLLEQRLAAASTRGALPLATLAVAVQDSFVTTASTGLETAFASLLVCAGLLLLVRCRKPGDWSLSGLLFILATLTRPDHAIFYVAGGLLLLGEQSLSVWREGRIALRSAVLHSLAYAAPFLLYLAHLAFRRAYYGEWLPNTFYAKAASQTYYSQGLRYAATFYLASHFWALLLVLVPWLCWPSRSSPITRFKIFVATGLMLHNYYVLKVGGDFMFGRFYVVLIPLILIGVTQAARDLLSVSGKTPLAGHAVIALLGATLGGVQVIPPRQLHWGIADERTYYPLTDLSPPIVDHFNFRVAQVMATWHAAGLDLRIATPTIGMIGYFSRMEVIDLRGLTDAAVARQTLRRRGRPGHEHRAEDSYIRARAPHLVRWSYHDRERESLTQLSFGPHSGRPWHIYQYDHAVMERIAALTPGVRFRRFERFLRGYIKRQVPGLSEAAIDRDQEFFQRYYFDHNDDPKLLAAWDGAVAARRAKLAAP